MRYTAANRAAFPAGMLAIFAATTAGAQGGGNAPTGGQTLAAMSFAGAQLGTLPSGIDLLNGTMDVVDKSGKRMLRATSNSTFLVHLPAPLPQDFLIELEFIPKISVSSEDFHVEGTRDPDGGDQSTVLYWYSSNVKAVGGGSHFDTPMPAALYGILAGNLTRVAVSVHGRLMRVYANGQLTHTIPNRKFVRNDFVRVFLGGEDNDQNAVYLSSIRIANLGPAIVLTSNNSGSTSGGSTGSGSTSTGGSSSSGQQPNAIANLTVTDSPSGPLVNWSGVSGALYTVQRWLISDPVCCANGSSAPLSSPPWQDKPPTVSGTYLYSVTASTSSGPTAAQTQFSYTVPVPTVNVPTSTTSKVVTNTLPFGPSTSVPNTSTTGGSTSGGGTPGGSTANSTAVPTNLQLQDMTINYSWGIAMQFTGVPNAVSYRIHRTVTGSGPAIVAEVVDVRMAAPPTYTFVDPFVMPSTNYTYWVEAVFSDGSASGPSAISSVMTANSFKAMGVSFGVPVIPLQAAISGTKTVTLSGAYAAMGTVQGSDVTWTFGIPGVPIFIYETSFQIAPPTGLGGSGNPVDRTTIRTQTAAPGSSPGTVTFTRAVPRGMVVRFCVWFYADPDVTKPLPAEATCLMSTVP